MDTVAANQITQALSEINTLYQVVQTKGLLDNWRVSPATDALLQFSRKYQARLTAGKTLGDPAELRTQLASDLKTWLHTLQAMQDFVTARGSAEFQAKDLPEATARYNVRAAALAAFLDELSAAPLSTDETKTAAELQPQIVQKLSGESEREIFQVVSRIVPVDQPLEEELTSLQMNLIKSAHTEMAIQALVTDENILLADDDRWRSLAGSQALRDYVAPYLAALIKKSLSIEGVDAFDEAFRNTYFAVVNRVLNYYQEYTPPVAASSQKPADKSQKTSDETLVANHQSRFPTEAHKGEGESIINYESGAAANGQSTQVTPAQPEPDNSTNTVPLPPLDTPERPIVPLITEAEADSAEILADGKSVRIQGAGLE